MLLLLGLAPWPKGGDEGMVVFLVLPLPCLLALDKFQPLLLPGNPSARETGTPGAGKHFESGLMNCWSPN